MSALSNSDRRRSRTPRPATPGTPDHADEFPGLPVPQGVRHNREKDRSPQVCREISRQRSVWKAGWLPAILLAGLLAGTAAHTRRYRHAHVAANRPVACRDQRAPVARYTTYAHCPTPPNRGLAMHYVSTQHNTCFPHRHPQRARRHRLSTGLH